MNALGQVETKDPFVFHENQVGDFSPRSTTWSFQVEQPITLHLRLRASYFQNKAAAGSNESGPSVICLQQFSHHAAHW